MEKELIVKIKDRAGMYFTNSTIRYSDELYLACCYIQAVSDICQQKDFDIRKLRNILEKE